MESRTSTWGEARFLNCSKRWTPSPITAVVINGEVMPRSRWTAVHLNEHDEVELLVMAAGG